MTDFRIILANLRRPRLLMRAARIGLQDYRRDRDLRRILPQTLFSALKSASPEAALVMMALAMPFGFIHDRMGGASARIFMGVMLGVGFHLLNGLFSNLGMINAWPPFMAALTPSLIFLAAAAWLLHYVERR